MMCLLCFSLLTICDMRLYGIYQMCYTFSPPHFFLRFFIFLTPKALHFVIYVLCYSSIEIFHKNDFSSLISRLHYCCQLFQKYFFINIFALFVAAHTISSLGLYNSISIAIRRSFTSSQFRIYFSYFTY